MIDKYKYRVFSKYFSFGSFSLFIPFLVIFGLLPKESEIYRSGPALGAIWFLVFAATVFFSSAAIYIVSFRRYSVSSKKFNCFNLVWVDPLDPMYLSARGRWRLLTIFLLMAVVVNTMILLVFPSNAVRLDQWTSPIFFLFWGNVVYSLGLLESILVNFRLVKSEIAATSIAATSDTATNLPLLGDDLCLGYRLYWVFAIAAIVVCVGYALNFTIGEGSMERSPAITLLYMFLLILSVGAMFGLAILGAKLLHLKEPSTK